MAGLKKEEESVDICLTRSVSQVGEKFGAEESPHRALRARGPPTLPVVKKEREERSVSQSKVQRLRPNSRNGPLPLAKSAGSKAARTTPKVGKGTVVIYDDDLFRDHKASRKTAVREGNTVENDCHLLPVAIVYNYL